MSTTTTTTTTTTITSTITEPATTTTEPTTTMSTTTGPNPTASPAPIPAEAYTAWMALAATHHSDHHSFQQTFFRNEALSVATSMGLPATTIDPLFHLDNEALLASFLASHPNDDRAVWLVWEVRKWVKEMFRWAMVCVWMESEAETECWSAEKRKEHWEGVLREEEDRQTEWGIAKEAWEVKRRERKAAAEEMERARGV